MHINDFKYMVYNVLEFVIQLNGIITFKYILGFKKSFSWK